MFAQFLRDVILQVGSHEKLEALVVDGLQNTNERIMSKKRNLLIQSLSVIMWPSAFISETEDSSDSEYERHNQLS